MSQFSFTKNTFNPNQKRVERCKPPVKSTSGTDFVCSIFLQFCNYALSQPFTIVFPARYISQLSIKTFIVKMKAKSLDRVRLFVTPWNVACQARSMGFSRKEYWSGLPFPSPGDLTQGWNPGLLHCRHTLYRLSHPK